MLLGEHVHCVAFTFKMTERVERQICIKFCIKLEHSSPETVQTIQKAFGQVAMGAAQKKVWCSTSKTVKDLLRVIHILEGLPQSEHLRMKNGQAAIEKYWPLTL